VFLKLIVAFLIGVISGGVPALIFKENIRKWAKRVLIKVSKWMDRVSVKVQKIMASIIEWVKRA